MKAPRIAVGLARCSTDRQDKSIADQGREIRKWAAERQLEVQRIFDDEAVSGSVLDRPGVRSLLQHLATSPEKGVVIAWKRDRLARALDPREAMALEWKILESGWRLDFINGFAPTGDPMMDALGSVMEHIQAGMQLKNVSIDVLRRLVNHVLDGDQPGGKIPYGYAKQITASDGQRRIVARRERHRKVRGERATLVAGDPVEVQVLQRIFNAYVNGEHGLARLAQQLNLEKVPAVEGGPWTAGTLRDLLLNPAYVGDLVWNKETSATVFRLAGGKPVARERPRKSRRPGFEHKTTSYAANDPLDWIRIPAHHEALVDRAVFDRAAQLMHSRGGQRNKGRADSQLYPLSGVAHCEACGSTMNGRTTVAKNKPYRRYFCSSHSRDRSCAPNSLLADRFERRLLAKMRELFLSPVPRADLRERIVRILRERVVTPEEPAGIDEAALKHEHATLERRIARAVENLSVVGSVPAVELGRQIEVWAGRRATIDEKLAQADRDKRNHLRRSEDVERAADEALALVNELETIGMDSPDIERRRLFRKALKRLDVRFRTEPAADGRKRERHVFELASVQANGLLSLAQQAGCTEDWLLG